MFAAAKLSLLILFSITNKCILSYMLSNMRYYKKLSQIKSLDFQLAFIFGLFHNPPHILPWTK